MFPLIPTVLSRDENGGVLESLSRTVSIRGNNGSVYSQAPTIEKQNLTFAGLAEPLQLGLQLDCQHGAAPFPGSE